jgi:hypothetical protein
MRPVIRVSTSGTDESNGIRTSLGEPFWLLCSSPHRKDERDGPAPTPRMSFFKTSPSMPSMWPVRIARKVPG